MATEKKRAHRPTLAVWKFTSCDGCQLSLLDCENELLAIADAIDIAYFPEATRASSPGPYDISLVEGSLSTPEHLEQIQHIRAQSHVLVSIGACATSGGIQALRNARDVEALTSMVYAHPEYIDTLAESRPIASEVKVDFALRGCPIDKKQLIELIAAFLHKRAPNITTHSVCVECKLSEVSCLLVSRGIPCLGPVTQAGCGALCPRFDRGCFGCFGPKETPNVASLIEIWRGLGVDDQTIQRTYQGINVAAPAFAKVQELLTKPTAPPAVDNAASSPHPSTAESDTP